MVTSCRVVLGTVRSEPSRRRPDLNRIDVLRLTMTGTPVIPGLGRAREPLSGVSPPGPVVGRVLMSLPLSTLVTKRDWNSWIGPPQGCGNPPHSDLVLISLSDSTRVDTKSSVTSSFSVRRLRLRLPLSNNNRSSLWIDGPRRGTDLVSRRTGWGIDRSL